MKVFRDLLGFKRIRRNAFRTHGNGVGEAGFARRGIDGERIIRSLARRLGLEHLPERFHEARNPEILPRALRARGFLVRFGIFLFRIVLFLFRFFERLDMNVVAQNREIAAYRRDGIRGDSVESHEKS